MLQADLESLFSPYGRIITSRILCDNITGEWTSSISERVVFFYYYFIFFLIFFLVNLISSIQLTSSFCFVFLSLWFQFVARQYASPSGETSPGRYRRNVILTILSFKSLFSRFILHEGLRLWIIYANHFMILFLMMRQTKWHFIPWKMKIFSIELGNQQIIWHFNKINHRLLRQSSTTGGFLQIFA